MDTERAFVSSRLPIGLRDRLKTFASVRGETVQTVVERAVTRLLDEEAREPPTLGAVLRKLRDSEDALRQEGVTGIWVFGSIARGDSGPDSDVDLAVEMDARRRVSLLTLGRLQTLAESILGAKVDLGIRSDLRPQVADAFARDAVQVF